ncbi:MAG: PEP-CTERM sorting domain-containing protein [Verrucomicrobiia bacterium]
MRKRIFLLGSALTVVALPLYADNSNPSQVLLDNPPTALHLQIVNSLITGTDNFSILDTSRLSNPEGGTGNAKPAPVLNLNHPVVPVPEPMNYLLMGLGVIGLFLARRDRLSAK